MSTRRGTGGGGNGGGVQLVPAGSRKMVQSLKEIVDCSEAEIYATLKDCDMDPNEAVNRLLSQDPFHEVKSKREKKKEGKDTTEPRPRGPNHNSNRGSKINTDGYLSRGGTTPYSFSEPAPLPGKSSNKKENGSNHYSNSLSSLHGVSGNDRSRVPAGFSDDASAENKGSFWTSDAMPHGIQPASGFQSARLGPPGQMSMADIVKKGTLHNKAPNAQNLRFPEDHHESGISAFHNFPTNEEWPSVSSVENPAVTNVISMHSEKYVGALDVSADSINRPYETEEIEEAEGDDIEDLYNNLGSYQHQAHDFHEDEEIDAPLSSVTRNFQQLNVEKGDNGLPSEGYTASVVIPDHLQVQDADCSHLSFGSFGPKKSLPVKSNLEKPHNEVDVSSHAHLNRSSEYFVDSLGNASDVGLFHRTNPSAGGYDSSLVSRLEELKQPVNSELGNQYSYHTSNHGYTFDDAKHLNVPFSRSTSQMQNLASFSNDMPYTNSLPSNLPPANVQITSREPDIQLSQFPATQSLSSNYGNVVSTIANSTISPSEALKTGHSLPQHPSIHQFLQPTHHLGPYANMNGYPFMPQSYTYVPSAFQQTFAGNAYHQSLAALLPQHKNSVSSGSFTQSAAGSGAQNLSYDDVLSSQYKDKTSHLASLQQQNENSGMWLKGLNSRTSNYYNYQQGQNQLTAEGFRQIQQQPSQNYGHPNFYHAQGGGISLDQQQSLREGSLGSYQGQPKQSKFWRNGY